MTGTQSEFDKIFDLCLERLQGGGEHLSAILADYPDYGDELRPLLEASVWLFEGKSTFDPRPSFVAVSRKSLISRIQAQTALGNAPVQEPTQKSFLARLWRRLTSSDQTQTQRLAFQLAFAMVLLLGLVLGGTGLASWASTAQPGDALYPVKIAFEQFELGFAFDARSDIRLHMAFARLRSDEMQSLVSSSQFTYLHDLLANYRYHMDEALRLLALLVEDDPEAARILAVDVHELVVQETGMLLSLAQSVPQQIFSGFSLALEETGEHVDLMLDILDDLDIEIDPVPTPGSVRIPTRTPAPTQTSPPPRTPSSGADPSPTTTPTPTQTATQTPTSTPTSTPPSGWVPTSTSTQRPAPPRSTNTPLPTHTATVTFSPTATKKPPTPTITIPLPTATATSPPPPPTPTATSPPPPPTPTPTDPPYPR